MPAAVERGIVVTNTPDVLTDATADVAMLCLLGAARRAHEAQTLLREGNWKLHGNPKDNSQKAPITKNDKLFLANLAMDPTEMTNLAFKYPEVVKRLSDLQSEYDSSIQQTLQSER